MENDYIDMEENFAVEIKGDFDDDINLEPGKG